MTHRLPVRLPASAVLLAGLLGGAPAAAETVAPPAPAPGSSVRVHYSWKVDVPLLAGGLGGMILGNNIATETLDVPPGGLDPGRIHWGIDRDALHELDESADRLSDKVLTLSVFLPLTLGVVTAPSGERWHAAGDRSAMTVESMAVALGAAAVLKNVVSRPRPFNYLDEAQRPDAPHWDSQTDRAFQSMPSGHATTVWCSAALLWMDPWLDEPEATWKRRAGIPCLGSTVAMLTGGLRVEAGQHFPTDVAAGALLGAASGTLVPLLHGYQDHGRPVPRPTAQEWLERGAGVAVGIGLGALLTEVLSGQ